MASPPALLVIGVSRSGSSALAGVLGLLGAALPEHLLGAGPGNERGHFEPLPLMELNETILRAHGGTYWDPIAIAPAWFDSAEAAAFVTRIAATIAAEYGPRALPVIKDPRLCRLAPLYVRALAQLGMAAHAILPLRHPGEAAGSLTRRDGTDPATAELLYVRDLLSAEAFSRGMKRVWTSYDGLLTDWQTTAAHIAATLGIAFPTPAAQAAAAIDAFLSPEMRRFDGARAQGTAGPLARRVWQAAQPGPVGDEIALRAGFDTVQDIAAELDRLSIPSQTVLRARLAAALATIQAQGHDIARLTADVAAREESLAVLRASTSWRLTAPMRALGQLLGR